MTGITLSHDWASYGIPDQVVTAARSVVKGFDGFDPVRQLTYLLMLTQFGTLDRQFLGVLFGVPSGGLSDQGERVRMRNEMAYGVGGKLFDTAVSVRQYLATWFFPSVCPGTRACHDNLKRVLVDAFSLAGQMTANSSFSQNKPFRDVILLAQHIWENATELQSLQKGKLQCRSRREWLETMVMESTRLVLSCRMICDVRSSKWCLPDTLNG